MIGKKVIIRADRAGVFFGTLKEKVGNEVTLTDCRRLWYWHGAKIVNDKFDSKTQSCIKWQTGEPTGSGSYLASIKGIESHFVTCVIYNRFTGWCHWKKEKIVAWCKLSDIEPYKEEAR